MKEKDAINEQPLPDTVPQISVNETGAANDSTVVVEEADRTVVLTQDETIVIEKQPRYDMPPANRPRKVYKGMWGTPELAALGASFLTILAVIALYLFFVAPSNRELELAKADRDGLEKERTEAQAKYGNITSTQQRVAELIESVDSFESGHLPVASTGRTALYQRLNSLIAGYGLINTSGPDYAPLELEGGPTRSGEDTNQRGRDRFLSIFPGVYVTMTVEGSYSSIRRFIRDIETGREFVLISSVELEPSETRRRQPADQQTDQPAEIQDPTRGVYPPGFNQFGTQSAPQPRRQQGRTLGDVVSLRLEMAAYFRRMNSLAVPASETLR